MGRPVPQFTSTPRIRWRKGGGFESPGRAISLPPPKIRDCCSHFKLPYAIEVHMSYPVDFLQRGRVRVQLKREDGTSSNPAIPSSNLVFREVSSLISYCFCPAGKQLMLHVAELVPRHPGRTKKQEPTSTFSSGPSRSKAAGIRDKLRYAALAFCYRNSLSERESGSWID